MSKKSTDTFLYKVPSQDEDSKTYLQAIGMDIRVFLNKSVCFEL